VPTLQRVWLLLIAALLLWTCSFPHLFALDLLYCRLKPSIIALELHIEIIGYGLGSTSSLENILAWLHELLFASLCLERCLGSSTGVAMLGQHRLGNRDSDLYRAVRCCGCCFLLLDLDLLELFQLGWLPSLSLNNVQRLVWRSCSIWLFFMANRDVL
jgi:hypothetical protein